jgi:hypothetical protein
MALANPAAEVPISGTIKSRSIGSRCRIELNIAKNIMITTTRTMGVYVLDCIFSPMKFDEQFNNTD